MTITPSIPAPEGPAASLIDLEPGSFDSHAALPAHGLRSHADRVLEADLEACALRSSLDRIVLVLCRAARRFVEGRVWVEFGHARLDDHARERLRRSGRWVRDLAALGKAIAELPALAAALTGDDGDRPVGRVAALLIGRVASTDSLAEWVALARSSTVRRLRAQVASARAASSDRPTQRPDRTGVAGAPSLDPSPAAPTVPVYADASLDPLVVSAALPDEAESGGERCLSSLPLPSALRVAFDETLELYRSVEGRQATVTSFVEALTAESLSGPHPPDLSDRTLRRGVPAGLAEETLARTTERWKHLPVSSSPVTANDAATGRLRELGSLVQHASPTALDAALRELIDLEGQLERRLGELLAELADVGGWMRLRFAGVGHYAEQRLGLSRSTGQDRARTARLLRESPALNRAYESGSIGLQATLTLLRLLRRAPHDPALASAWAERASTVTLKRLRDECRAWSRSLGGLPPPEDIPDLPPIQRERPASEPATASDSTPDSPPGCDADLVGPPRPLSDEAWLASLHRVHGTARARVRSLGLRSLATRWADDWLRLRLPRGLADDFAAAVESSRAGLTAAAEQVPWDEPWPDPDAPPSLLAARTFSIRCRLTPGWVGLLGLLESFADTWDVAGPRARRRGDTIYARHGWRCAAPGCSSRRNLEDHHLVYRSRGGSDRPDNRLCLCRFHHERGEHGHLASCRGEAPLGVLWVLGRHGVGGAYRNERRCPASIQ